MEIIKLTGRNSRLSLLQIDIVRKKIEAAFPGITVEVISRTSRGDLLQDIPLHTVEGNDFFTREIFDMLKKGEADIAVHSLKDMSSEHFFGANQFAVVDRDDTRDVVIFNGNIEEKISRGEVIIVGTCSPRREEMAIGFLQKALPQIKDSIHITTKPIRGNVETRLRKLSTGEYDATILASAGLNRLLRSGEDALVIRKLLQGKKIMLLPLFECVPAPCQGAIVAEAHYSNKRAVEILDIINEKELLRDCAKEKELATAYGTGCIQQFGVTTIYTKQGKLTYAAGKDAEGTDFLKYDPLPAIGAVGGPVFSTTDQMKSFFEYKWKEEKIVIDKPVVFVANYKVIGDVNVLPLLKEKIILASGTKTWLELAKKGIWVTVSADALGFEFLLSSLGMPLLQIAQDDICILTHEEAAKRWRNKNIEAAGNYILIPKNDEALKQTIASANTIFWTSFSQYEHFGQYAKKGVIHTCPGGETATLLQQAGMKPVIFPTIKSFQQWRRSFIPSRKDA